MRPRSTSPRLLVAGLTVGALLLAACGDDGDAGDTTSAGGSADGATTAGSGTTAAPTDVDPDGVLKIGFNLAAAGGVFFDPRDQQTPGMPIHYNIYGTLLRQQQDGTYEPGLAREATIVDPQTIEVVLQEGVTFQDGTPLDAEDVKATIERNLGDAKAVSRMSELTALAGPGGSVEVTSPTTLTLHLSTPTAGSFYNLLAHNETMPLPKEGLDSGHDFNADPIGAGPFKLVSQDAQRIVLEKWDGYFRADDIQLAGVEWVHVDPASLVPAMRSGAIDVAVTTIDQNQQLAGSGLEVRSEPSPDKVSWMAMMCERQPAFGDIRVRQALNHATDKEAVLQAIYAGQGTVMTQFWTPAGGEFYLPEIEGSYPYDVEKAKQLLAEAGYSDLRLIIPSTGGQQQRLAELLQAQWAEAGIEVEIFPSTNVIQDVYIDKKTDFFQQGGNRFWTDKITRVFMPGSIGTTCDPKDPVFTKMVNDLRALDRTDPRAVSLWHDISRYLNDNAFGVWLVNPNDTSAYNGDVLGNPTWTPEQVGNYYPDVHEVYVKA